MKRDSSDLEKRIRNAIRSSDLLQTAITGLGLSFKTETRMDHWPIQKATADFPSQIQPNEPAQHEGTSTWNCSIEKRGQQSATIAVALLR
eukprot:5091923-Pyramimonas_sp.AAC.1